MLAKALLEDILNDINMGSVCPYCLKENSKADRSICMHCGELRRIPEDPGKYEELVRDLRFEIANHILTSTSPTYTYRRFLSRIVSHQTKLPIDEHTFHPGLCLLEHCYRMKILRKRNIPLVVDGNCLEIPAGCHGIDYMRSAYSEFDTSSGYLNGITNIFGYDPWRENTRSIFLHIDLLAVNYARKINNEKAAFCYEIVCNNCCTENTLNSLDNPNDVLRCSKCGKVLFYPLHWTDYGESIYHHLEFAKKNLEHWLSTCGNSEIIEANLISLSPSENYVQDPYRLMEVVSDFCLHKLSPSTPLSDRYVLMFNNRTVNGKEYEEILKKLAIMSRPLISLVDDILLDRPVPIFNDTTGEN